MTLVLADTRKKTQMPICHSCDKKLRGMKRGKQGEHFYCQECLGNPPICEECGEDRRYCLCPDEPSEGGNDRFLHPLNARACEKEEYDAIRYEREEITPDPS